MCSLPWVMECEWGKTNKHDGCPQGAEARRRGGRGEVAAAEFNGKAEGGASDGSGEGSDGGAAPTTVRPWRRRAANKAAA